MVIGLVVAVAKKYRDVYTLLRQAGWFRLRQAGSHEVWMHPAGGRVVVPGGGRANREVPAGTLASIRKSTGIEDLR